MKKILFLFIVSTFLFCSYEVLAEENLPDPGILPDSNFYFLKSWKESIQTFFTFGAENKAKQFLHLSEVRLAEYQKMVEKGKIKIAEKIIQKYEKQLNLALKKTDEAENKGKDAEKLKEEISEKILKHQEVLERVLEKVPEQARSGIENAIEMSQKGFENAIQVVTGEKKWELEKKEGEMKVRIKEKTVKPKPSMNISLPWATGTFQAEFPSFFLTGQPIMIRPPGSPMPQPVAEQRPVLKSMNDDEWCAKKRMRIDDHSVKYILEMLGVVTVKVGSVDCRACYVRKFSEGGELVAERWDDMYFWYLQKLSGKWACEKSINYKNFIGSGWTDYYQISESWSPQNFYYQCVKREGAYVSGSADYCEKEVPASAILPPPAATSSTSVIEDVSCQRGKMEDYKCPNGSLVKWRCQCKYDESNGEEWRHCAVNPADSCSLSVDSSSLTISSIQTRYSTWQQGRPGEAKSISMQFFWKTNKPTTSWIEYGLTTAYGSKVLSYAPSPDYDEHGTYDLPAMQRDTTYHFRIIAEDVQGNKIVSDDYTFTTGL